MKYQTIFIAWFIQIQIQKKRKKKRIKETKKKKENRYLWKVIPVFSI